MTLNRRRSSLCPCEYLSAAMLTSRHWQLTVVPRSTAAEVTVLIACGVLFGVKHGCHKRAVLSVVAAGGRVARGLPGGGAPRPVVHVSKQAARSLAELRNARSRGTLTPAGVRRRALHMSRSELLAMLARTLTERGARDEDTMWIMFEVYGAVREQVWYRPDLRLGARIVAALEKASKADQARDLWNRLHDDFSRHRKGEHEKSGETLEQQTPFPFYPLSGSDGVIPCLLPSGHLMMYEELLCAYAVERLPERAHALFSILKHGGVGGSLSEEEEGVGREGERMKTGCGGVNRRCYAALIAAYANAGKARDAIVVLEEMLSAGQGPSWGTVRVVMEACGRDGLWEEMEGVMSRACTHMNGGVPTPACFAVLVTTYGSAGRVDLTLQALERMKAAGLELGKITMNALVSSCQTAPNGKRFDVVSMLTESLAAEDSLESSLAGGEEGGARPHGKTSITPSMSPEGPSALPRPKSGIGFGKKAPYRSKGKETTGNGGPGKSLDYSIEEFSETYVASPILLESASRGDDGDVGGSFALPDCSESALREDDGEGESKGVGAQVRQCERGAVSRRAPGWFVNRLIVSAERSAVCRALSLVRVVGLPRSACRWDERSGWLVDTHGMSAGAAQIAVLLWLEEIEIRLRDDRRDGLVEELPNAVRIITGWGRHSPKIGESEVKESVRALLSFIGVPFSVSSENRGVLVAKVESLRECFKVMQQ